MRKLKTIELFAGAGDLALGLEKAGFEPIGLIEFEKTVADFAANAIPKDSVIESLNNRAKARDGSFALALYMLGFSSYTGFKQARESR